MFVHDQISILMFDDVRAGFLTDQSTRQVVPNAMLVEINPRIQHAVSNQTDVECRRAKRTKLTPLWSLFWNARNTNDRLAQLNAFTWAHRNTIMKRTAASSRPIMVMSVRLVYDEPRAHAIFVDCTQSSCEPWHATAGICRPIKRIDHDAKIIIAEHAGDFTLFRQNRNTSALQHFERRAIGPQIN